MILIIVSVIVVLIMGVVLWGPIASRVEQAKYTVVQKDGDFEIRYYESMLVAETSVAGDRETAINRGFRVIADYIFGNNASTQKIAMTAPVTQSCDGKLWLVRFVMPAKYTMETLPKPSQPAVKLLKIPPSRYAVVRFSGVANAESLERHTHELESFINKNELKAVSSPIYAFFNPPWTLPFLRRNEVMIEVKAE